MDGNSLPGPFADCTDAISCSFILHNKVGKSVRFSVFTVLGGSVVPCRLCVMMFLHRTGLRTESGSVQGFELDQPTAEQLGIEEAN